MLFGELKDMARRVGVRGPLFIAGGSRPIEDLPTARNSHPDAWNIVLIDSEGPADGFEFMCRQRRINLEPEDEESVYWMVQVMESWFLADIGAVARYYGIATGALHGNPRVEEILKRDVSDRLHQATRHTRKGPYHKTRHAPDLLARIDPGAVKKAAPHCHRLFEAVLRKLEQH